MFVGQKIGPFHVEKELGSGAMGTVYRARYDKDGKERTVAIKIIALGLLGNEGAMARFEREANILKQLRHPHIVRLFATGKYKNTPFIAMELVDGEPLDRILSRRGRLGWEEAVAYAKQLCEALQYAHEKGIIHRDLKPSNLMITPDGVLKLTDFGIAKDTDVTALTGANSTIGTAAYMSPEQCKGDKNLTNKSDLYSLGIVMYELITGKKPFVSDTTIDMFLKHVHEIPPRPSRFIADVPVWLDNMIMFLIEKDKDKRPMDADTVRKMLEDIEEKVQNLQSAGEEVANARRMDRPINGGALDADDLAAARSLKAAKSGKKIKKKKSKPLMQRTWVRALPLALGLFAVVGGAYYVLKPPSQADVFKRVENAGTPDDRISMAKKYLDSYGSQTDEDTGKVKELYRKALGEKLQAVLELRFRKAKITTAMDDEDGEAFKAAWSAMEAEQKGELTTASALWGKVKSRAPDAKDKYTEGWAWLAEHRASAIKDVDRQAGVLKDELIRSEINEVAWKYDPLAPEWIVKRAIRLGAAGGLPAPPGSQESDRKLPPRIVDKAKVRKTWAMLADLTKDKSEHHVWYMLAVRERDGLKDIATEEAVAARKKIFADQLAGLKIEWQRVVGDSEARAEKRDCRNRCRDLIELYDDETDDQIKKEVDAVKLLLIEMNMPKGS